MVNRAISKPEMGMDTVMTASGVPEGWEKMPKPCRQKMNPKQTRKRATASTTR